MNIDRLNDLVNIGVAEGVSSGLDAVVSGVTSAVQTAGAAGLKDVFIPTDPADLEIPARPDSLGKAASFTGPLEYLSQTAAGADLLTAAHSLTRDAFAEMGKMGPDFEALHELRGSWLNASGGSGIVDNLLGPRGLLTPVAGGADLTPAESEQAAEPGRILDFGLLGVKVRDVADEREGNKCVLPDAGPYVRELADEREGNKCVLPDAGPYVRELAAGREGGQHVLPDAGPYVRELAAGREGGQHVLPDAGPYVRELAAGREGGQHVLPDAGPYVRELAAGREGGQHVLPDAGPYVRQLADEREGNKCVLPDAGPYVRELADGREGNKCVLPDAGPYVRELAGESPGGKQAAGAAARPVGGWPGGIDDSLQELARADPFTPEGVGELSRLRYQLEALDGLQKTVGGLLSLHDRLDGLRSSREV